MSSIFVSKCIYISGVEHDHDHDHVVLDQEKCTDRHSVLWISEANQVAEHLHLHFLTLLVRWPNDIYETFIWMRRTEMRLYVLTYLICGNITLRHPHLPFSKQPCQISTTRYCSSKLRCIRIVFRVRKYSQVPPVPSVIVMCLFAGCSGHPGAAKTCSSQWS